MVQFYGRFGDKITQEYGSSDSIYFPVNPCNYCGVIADFDDKGDWKKEMTQNSRCYYNLFDSSWKDQSR